jgi:transposase
LAERRPEMGFYSGVDLHSNNCVIAVVDHTGRRLKRKRVANEVALVEAVLAPYREELMAVVVESTYNWYWLVDGLQEGCYPVRLAHPAGNRPYSGLKHSDDVDDAFFLADLARLNCLSEGYVYPRETRGVRDLLRQRSRLVRQRTSHVLSIKNVIAREGGPVLTRAQVEGLRAESIEELVRDCYGQVGVKAVRKVLGVINEQIGCLEKTVLAQVKPDPLFKHLQTIWGVGPVLGVTIRLESGEMRRFPTVGDYTSYCRGTGSERLSNGKPKGENNKRNGNAYLAWAFVEAAHFARVNYPLAQCFFERKRAESNAILASKALASKLTKAAYYVMRDRVNFDPERLFR